MARFSVVVSALDQQTDPARCLRAIDRAAQAIQADVEVIVITNASGIAAARNDGARQAAGQILVTINVDRVMSPVTFAEIERLLATGCYVGGGAVLHTDRHSLSIDLLMAVNKVTSYINGLGGGMYWCRLDDFEEIGGFDERVTTVDDLDFARRLRDHGLRTGRKFVNLRQAPVTMTCRNAALGRYSHAVRH
jgi:hypothetical protein